MRRKVVSVFLGLLVALAWLVAPRSAEAPLAEVERLYFEEPLHVWTGTASWYGPGFHGRLTASGDVFDMYANTAAHLTLPLGSLVRVVNPRTGQSRVVRITDRGPYIEGREIDVSYDVARSLGFETRGLARLRLELLEVPRGRWFRPSQTEQN